MPGYFNQDFPYQAIARFENATDMINSEYPANQLWSVCCQGDTWSYGPCCHIVGVDHYIATAETHDGNTYYEEPIETGEGE